MSLWDAFRSWAAPEPPKPAAPSPFVPEFEEHYVINEELERVGDPRAKIILNSRYYANEATAAELMRRLGAARIELRKHSGGMPVGGVKTPTNPLERWLVWPDGLSINAGLLADYWMRMPESEHPGAAERDARRMIDAMRLNWIENYGRPQ